MVSGLEVIIGRLLTVGARVSALMLFAPFFSSMTIAPRIKAGFTLVLTALLCPAVGENLPSFTGAKEWKVAGGELVVGLILGITLQNNQSVKNRGSYLALDVRSNCAARCN